MGTRLAQALRSGAIAVIFLSCAIQAPGVLAEDADGVAPAVAMLRSWLDRQPTGKGWSEYLNLPALETEVAKGKDADPKVGQEVLKSLNSGAAGLELPQFSGLRAALSNWPAQIIVARSPNLAEAAKGLEGNYQPPSDAELAAANTALKSAANRLERYWKANPKIEAGWKEYLEWKSLRAQLAAAPDLEALKSIQNRFSADQVGLELPVFADVGKAVTNFVQLLEARQDDAQAQYVAHLKDLAEKLKQFEESKLQATDTAEAIGADLGWLESMHQAGPLVRAVRERFSKPNLHGHVSSRLIDAGMAQHIDETGPITDNILGTAISGTAHTVADLDARLLPSESNVMLETRLKGTTHTNTVGYNGPATIYSHGTTNIEGSKRIIFDANGVASYPAHATATTQTQINGVGANGGIAQRVASKRVAESKSQAEQIAGSHAAARVRHRIEAQADKQLGKVNANYMKKIRNPLVRRNEFPSLLKFLTTDHSIDITALQANASQMAAPSEAPSVASDHDIALRLHESLVNNLADALLSGQTLKEKEVQDQVIEWRGELPESLKSEEDKDPWSITFAKSKPVTVKFSEDGVQITVRGQRYTSGEREFRAMNVTANYKIKPYEKSFRLVRDEELQIVPPDFVPGQTRLSVNQVSLKTLLQKKFGKLFEPELKTDTLTFSGQMEKAGPLTLKQLQTTGGWLVGAYLMDAPSEKKVAQASLGRKRD